MTFFKVIAIILHKNKQIGIFNYKEVAKHVLLFFFVITKNSNWKFELKIQLLLKDKIGLRMKNFNILEFMEKSDFQGGGGHEQPVQKKGLPEKGEHGQLVDLRCVLGKNRRVGTVFEGWVDTSKHTIPISFRLWCVKISCLLYAHSYMLLYTPNGLHSTKAIAIEEVLWCVCLMLFQILGEVFHKNEVPSFGTSKKNKANTIETW